MKGGHNYDMYGKLLVNTPPIDILGNNLQKAAACVASYLLLRPDDETMLNNKQFYLQQPGIDEGDFIPRKVSNPLW